MGKEPFKGIAPLLNGQGDAEADFHTSLQLLVKAWPLCAMRSHQPSTGTRFFQLLEDYAMLNFPEILDSGAT